MLQTPPSTAEVRSKCRLEDTNWPDHFGSAKVAADKIEIKEMAQRDNKGHSPGPLGEIHYDN